LLAVVTGVQLAAFSVLPPNSSSKVQFGVEPSGLTMISPPQAGPVGGGGGGDEVVEVGVGVGDDEVGVAVGDDVVGVGVGVGFGDDVLGVGVGVLLVGHGPGLPWPDGPGFGPGTANAAGELIATPTMAVSRNATRTSMRRGVRIGSSLSQSAVPNDAASPPDRDVNRNHTSRHAGRTLDTDMRGQSG
jgi:hypothetical protein